MKQLFIAEINGELALCSEKYVLQKGVSIIEELIIDNIEMNIEKYKDYKIYV